MRQIILLITLATLSFQFAISQNRKLPADTVVTTQHNVTINGTLINYTAKTGTQPVWDEMGEPIATLHLLHKK